MKKEIATTIALGTILVGITGCSSSTRIDEDYSRLQDDYNSVKSQLTEALDEVYDLKGEIASLNSQIDQYEEQIAELKKENSESAPEIPQADSQTGATLFFDNLSITIFSNKAYVTKIDNKFSTIDQHPVIAIPMNIMNIDNETNYLNMFYIKYFGSQGVEMNKINNYFDDGDVIFSKLRPGANITGTFYMLYDGAGTYYITFDNFSETKEVAITFNLT